MEININWEWLTIAYYAIMFVSASTAICFKKPRDLASYGKLTVDKKLGEFYISKKKYFGIMYIVGLALVFGLFYIFWMAFEDEKYANIVKKLSINTPKKSANELSFECTFISRHDMLILAYNSNDKKGL